jgi:two-component system sensor histidine kinase PhoQ
MASALLLPLFLGLTGFFLDRAFVNSLQVAERSRLRGHVNLLMSVAEPISKDSRITSLRLPVTMSEADFEHPNSGLYGYVFDNQKKPVWRSNSAALIDPPSYKSIAKSATPGKMVFSEKNITSKLHFVARYTVNWEDANGTPTPFHFVVIHSKDEFRAELTAYRSQLWRWLGAAGIFLLIAQTLILRWGLRPLGKLAHALKAMQSGDTSNIAGEHPRELQKIVDNLNQVLAREQALRQRYRNSLSDLAHSLKTPLAVLQSKLVESVESDNELQQIASEQVARMNQVVTYQLQRAVSSQQKGTFQRARLEPIAQRLFAALQKVYAHKQMEQELDLAAHSIVAGDEQDVMELLGNILETHSNMAVNKCACGRLSKEANCVSILKTMAPAFPLIKPSGFWSAANGSTPPFPVKVSALLSRPKSCAATKATSASIAPNWAARALVSACRFCPPPINQTYCRLSPPPVSQSAQKLPPNLTNLSHLCD